VGKPKYWWGQKVIKSDKCMGVSKLLEWAFARADLPKYTPMRYTDAGFRALLI